jgi:hypothetical protein
MDELSRRSRFGNIGRVKSQQEGRVRQFSVFQDVGKA